MIECRNLQSITLGEFGELVRFAIWLYHCNPAIRQVLQSARSKSYFKQMQLFSQKEQRFSMEESSLLQSEFLDVALASAESSFLLVLDQYMWMLDDYKDEGVLLCTSDRPVLLGGKNLEGHVGFGSEGALLYFPLSPDLCLVGRNMGKGRGELFTPCNNIPKSNLVVLPRLLMWAKSSNLIVASDISALPQSGTKVPAYAPEIVELEHDLIMVMR